MNILVTGAAGFIGAHVIHALLQEKRNIIGIDNLNSYYDVQLKRDRLNWIAHPNFTFHKMNLEDRASLNELFQSIRPDIVIHLGAQAGVRYSLKNPHAYIDSNIVGFMNILECCRHFEVKHLIYASSSSVYGANTKQPFSERDPVNHPVSLYAATKKSNELMAHTYSHLYGIPTTGLRFFTVYGPWGRPDMAYFSFTRRILEGKPIQIFNHGKMKRDFTYIDDIVQGIVRIMEKPPLPNPDWNREQPDPQTSFAPYKIYNIGNNKPVELMHFVRVLEQHLGREAVKEFLPMQPGDVHETYADISSLEEAVQFSPTTSIEEGLGRFVAWYKDYYKVN